MKLLKKRQYMSIIAIFLVLPMSNLFMNVTLANAQEYTSEQEIQEQTYTSHSSPYYFRVNDSSPLQNDDVDVEIEQSQKLPQTSQYWYSHQDFALSLYLDKYAITPGETINLNLKLTESFNPSPNSPVTIEIFKGFYRNYYNWYSGFYDSAQIFTHQYLTDENGEIALSFSDTSDPGSYTIFAYYNNDYVAVYREFSVSETGVFLKGSKYYTENQDYHAAVHLVNITDFSPMSYQNYTYTLSTYDYDVHQWVTLQTGEQQTDASGYDVFQTEPIIISEEGYYYFWNSLRLTIESEDGATYSTFLYKDWTHYYYTLWGGAQESNYDKYQFVVSSDKTIYSPGETIKLRTLVFQYTYLNETRIPYSNQELQLTIYNPSDLAIFWTTIQTNAEGVAIIEFPVDYDGDTGSYGFEFSIDDITYLHTIRVDYYEKPVFRVTIDTDGQEFFPKYQGLKRLYKRELFEGFVEVEYYFGQPVVDADVTLTLKNYYDGIVKEVSGKTNGLGQFKFSIDLKWLDDIDWSFNVDASVTDTYGRTAETSKKYTRMEDIIAYGYVNDWAPLPDEPTEYYFNVFQILTSDLWWGYEYNPLANVTAEIEVFGVKEYPIYITTIRSRTRLDSFTAITNEYGAGKVEFSLPLNEVTAYNLFEIQLNIELEDGRSTTWSTYYRYRKYKLDIQIQNSEINPGDTLQLSATYMDVLAQVATEGEGRIYIYDSEYRLLGRANFEIDGSRNFQVDIPNFAPDGTYYLHSYVYSRSNDYYGGFLYHSVHKEFSVGNANGVEFTTNSTSTSDYSIEVDLGDTLQIQGNSSVSTNQPHYFEIYKRGLLHSEQLSLVGNQFTKDLLITTDLGPDFCIMIYTISDSGKLQEKYIVVHVNFQSGFQLVTDKEIYEPGDMVTLTILPNDDNPMLISTTFIDSAVLAVEPEDDSELGYFERSSYHAYIGSGSSWGTGVFWENYAWISYEVPSGGFYYPFYLKINGGGRESNWDLITLEEGGGGIDLDSVINAYDINVRDNISESANWMPSKVISGPTNFTFQLPDNIGEWTIRIVGNALDEKNILWGDVQTIEIKAFLPFFVEFEPTAYSSQDEIVSLKAYIYNYVGTNLVTDVLIEAPGFDILNNPVQSVQVPHNFVSEVEFSLHARDPLLQNITVIAIGESDDEIYTDAKQMQTYIHPNGFDLTERWAEYINESMGSYLFNYTIDPASIYHQETFAFYDDIIDISIEGWEKLIGYPYGCVEQTSSKLVSTALVYRYLNQTGQLTNELIEDLIPMIMQGLSRLYNMQNQDGGWGWWYDYDSNIQMSTLALFTLQQVQLAGFNVNSLVLFKGFNFIINTQEMDGSWEYPYYSANDFEATIYTLRILISSTNKTTAMENAIQSGLDFLSLDWLDNNHQSSYGAALYLITTMDTPYENSTFKSTMLAYLSTERQTTGDTTYWENDGYYYWSNLGNRVEITAYATLALAKDDYLGNFAVIQKAVKFLLDSKSQWGWWSTADSSAAIYTLSEIKQLSGSTPLLDFNGSVNIAINSAPTPQITLNLTDSSNTPSAILTEISSYLETGENEINITISGTGQLAFIFEGTQLVRYTPTITIPPVVEVNNDHLFNITVDLDPVFTGLELTDVTLSLINLPEGFEGSTTYYIPSISEQTQFNFTLQAPTEEEEFYFEGIFVSMNLILNNETDNEMHYYRSIGPILVRVFEVDIPIAQTTLNIPDLESGSVLSSTSTVTESENGITLQKSLSKTTDVLPGDLLSVTLEIENSNSSFQYFALDDFIPTGMVLAAESILINDIPIGSDLLSITLESSRSEMHYFIPLLPTGTTTIQYNLLVDSVKNSLIPSAILWGMYENITVVSEALVLMNLPLHYHFDNSIYQDLTIPTINEVSLAQIEEIDEVELLLNVVAIDNNDIYKVRFVYQQGLAWRSQSVYYCNGMEEFEITIEGLDNVDSKVNYFVEVQDEYGNLISSTIQTITVHSTIIPYLMIGIGIGIAVAVASITAIIYKKKYHRTTPIEGISFTDDAEQSDAE
ncbi:MAG: MG2 domain-containing protein [Promethearchaeota archaeon]